MTREFLSGMGTSARNFLGKTSAQERADVRPNLESELDIPELNSLALQSLVSLFDEKARLFSHRITLTDREFRRDEPSRKRTMIALLGLHRLEEFGGTHPFDTASIRKAVLQDKSWVKSAGDLGILTWFMSVCAPDLVEALFQEYDFEKALTTYSDGRQARTEGLAWFLAGIAHVRLARPEALPDLTDVAVDAYRLLKDNQSEDGIFGHAGLTAFPRKVFYRRLGTFSDQICAIYALSTFARAFHIDEPLESALNCANSICALQGEMGQWWFLYDKRAGRVVSRYPVFSAQQDGTAPCALFALEEATGRSFQKPMLKGLSWIAGANELGNDLRSPDGGLIWDSIRPRGRWARCWRAALGFVHSPRETDVNSLGIQYEARPDHFGWLLYAFGRLGLPKPLAAAKAATTH